MATIHGRYPCSGDSSSNQSEIIRSAEADPDYTVRPRARSAQGNKRLLKSATAFSRLRSCALHFSPEHVPDLLHSARQKRPEMPRFYRAELYFGSGEAKT